MALGISAQARLKPKAKFAFFRNFCIFARAQLPCSRQLQRRGLPYICNNGYTCNHARDQSRLTQPLSSISSLPMLALGLPFCLVYFLDNTPLDDLLGKLQTRETASHIS